MYLKCKWIKPKKGFCWYLTYGLASDKWISCKTSWTATDRVVVHYFTASSHTTCAWTGVPTLLVTACLILTTLRAHYALWPTCWRTADEARYARAYSLSIDFTTLTVWATRWWITWLCDHRCYIERTMVTGVSTNPRYEIMQNECSFVKIPK